MSAVAARIAHQITRHVLDLRLSSLDAAAEAAAHRILADTEVAAGLRALHTVAALDARHQPRTWGGHSRVQVCDACQTAWPCPDRQILDGPPTPAAGGCGGSALPAAGLTFDEEMRTQLTAGQPIVDNAVNPTAVGAYGLEWDGDRCPDCAAPQPQPGACSDCTLVVTA